MNALASHKETLFQTRTCLHIKQALLRPLTGHRRYFSANRLQVSVRSGRVKEGGLTEFSAARITSLACPVTFWAPRCGLKAGECSGRTEAPSSWLLSRFRAQLFGSEDAREEERSACRTSQLGYLLFLQIGLY